jgi:hypothetical protein
MSVPYLGDVLDGWLSNQTISKITQSVDEYGHVMRSAVAQKKMMMLQPMPPEKLKQIPQESRSDSWWTLYVKESDLSLEMDDIIGVIYAGAMRSYQIKERNNWGQYGYCEYSCIEYEGQPVEVSTNG